MLPAAVFLLLALSVPGTEPLGNRISQDVPPFNYFDFTLTQGLGNNGKGNLVSSPASIKTALGLILEGAAGNTALQISNALRLPLNISKARHFIHDYQWMLKRPTGESGVEVKIATRLYPRKNSSVKDSFNRRALQFFGADAVESDFKRPWEVSNSINSWVRENTNNYITEIIKPENIDARTQLLMVNAVYFKGNWRYGFNPKYTRDSYFQTPGEKKKVRMMATSGLLKSGPVDKLNSQILELPYQNERYSMVILLPNPDIDLQRLVSDLPFNSGILPYLDSLKPYDTDLLLPSFKITYNTDLVPFLKKIGIVDLFSSYADLSDLLDSQVSVSSIIHQAKIEVNENGTIAGATTTVNVQLLSVSDKRKIIVNRPFLFFIRDAETGFLFNGQVVDPSVEQVFGLQAESEISGVKGPDEVNFEFPQKNPIFARA